MRLKDQVALVTGGSRGIGRAIVQAFGGRRGEGRRRLPRQPGSRRGPGAGGHAGRRRRHGLAVDVADAAAAQSCAEQVEKDWGTVDILVNNAGVIHDDLFVRMEPEAWNKVMQTNLGGVFNFCQAVAFAMMQGSGAGGSSMSPAWPPST